MDDYFMRKGHVPAFGSWDCEDHTYLPFGSWDCEDHTYLPFTECFESAREPHGLFHYAAYPDHHRDRDLYVAGDLYQNDHVVTPAVILVPIRRARGRNQAPMKEGKKQRWDTASELPLSPAKTKHRPTPKPVDEDLYKISPDLLFSKKPIKKKRSFGLFSSCLVPTCA